MEKRAKLKFIEVEKMIKSLNNAIELVLENTDVKYNQGLRDSVIQRFEYTIEGIWKFLKYFLDEKYGEDVEFPKQVIKSAYKAGIIKNLKIFIEMIERRNRLSHDYHDEFADISFDMIIEEYIDEINRFLTTISKEYE